MMNHSNPQNSEHYIDMLEAPELKKYGLLGMTQQQNLEINVTVIVILDLPEEKLDEKITV